MTPINPAAWNATLLNTQPAATALVGLSAVGAGRGGFRITANGAAFSPNVLLYAGTAQSIELERANGPAYTDVLDGGIGSLTIARNQDAAVAVILLDAAGQHVCGAVPAAASVAGSVFNLDRLTPQIT